MAEIEDEPMPETIVIIPDEDPIYYRIKKSPLGQWRAVWSWTRHVLVDENKIIWTCTWLKIK